MRNTAPFIFETPAPAGDAMLYIRHLQDFKEGELSHEDYFLLCLCAHWATAGTFVPTDVDNALRLKLWQMDPPVAARTAMAEWVLRARAWDYRPVTAKLARAPSGALLSTHEGTWFSVAVGAYAALREVLPAKADELSEAMVAEATREDALFSELRAAGDGLGVLRACALLAHNFGDLDRVMDLWNLPEDDPLRQRLYDAANPRSSLFAGRIAAAGALNQKFMAAENHRHFALREARFLRRSAKLLLPIAPFLDGWGTLVAQENPENVGEAVRVLIDGWHRLKVPTVGYPRALAGILEALPGGMERLRAYIPGRDERLLKSGPLRALISVERSRFEGQWARKIS